MTQHDIYIEDSQALPRILGFLNEGHAGHETISEDDRRLLHAMVSVWLSQHGHWEKFITAWLKSGRKFDFSELTVYIPSNGPKARLMLFPSAIKDQPHPKGVFLQFVLSGESWRLRLCEREGCGKFFLRKKQGTKSHCSQACQISKHAAPAMKARREKQREAEVDSAKAAIARHERLNKRDRQRWGWKEFVVLETELSKKKITQFLNNGDIQAPKEEA